MPPRSARERWLFPLLSVFIAACLLGIILEVALRLTGDRGDVDNPPPPDDALARSRDVEVEVVDQPSLVGLIGPSDDPELVYEVKPSRRWRFLGAEVRTNSHGFRGTEWNVAKPAATWRVLALGDSITWGWGVALEATYLEQLRRLVVQPAPGPVECLNLGVPGYNTAQEVALLERRGLAFSPDVVVVGYTLNDVQGPAFGSPPGPLDHSRLFRLLRARLQQVGVLDRPASRFESVEKALERLARLASRRGVPVVVFAYPQEIPGFADVPLPAVCARLGFTYVDLFAGFRAYYRAHGLSGLEAFYVTRNDAHPNAAGHALIARLLAPAVTSALARRAAARSGAVAR